MRRVPPGRALPRPLLRVRGRLRRRRPLLPAGQRDGGECGGPSERPPEPAAAGRPRPLRLRADAGGRLGQLPRRAADPGPPGRLLPGPRQPRQSDRLALRQRQRLRRPGRQRLRDHRWVNFKK